MQSLYFLFDKRTITFCKFLRFFMIYKSFIVKSIHLYICFRFFSISNHIFYFSICLKFWIACMSKSAVIKPISKTKPTKFVLTTFTGHMIAPLIFLNKNITFRASFCISFYPKYIFSVTTIFYFPLFEHFTCCRPMTFLTTSKAVNITTDTTN